MKYVPTNWMKKILEIPCILASNQPSMCEPMTKNLYYKRLFITLTFLFKKSSFQSSVFCRCCMT